MSDHGHNVIAQLDDEGQHQERGVIGSHTVLTEGLPHIFPTRLVGDVLIENALPKLFAQRL
jgi:hypothetical protein